MSLKSRILVVFGLLMLAGIWGMATRLSYVLESDLRESLSDQMSGTVDYVARQMDSEMAQRVQTLEEIARAMNADMISHPERARHFLSELGATRVWFPHGIQVLDANGIVVAVYPLMPDRLGQSRGDRDYFEKTMASGKTIIGQPMRGRLSHQPVLSIGAPIRDARGVVRGVLMGTIELFDRDLFGELADTHIGQSGYFVVISRKTETIVSATDKRRILQPIPAKGVNPLLDRRIYEGYEGPGVTVNSLGEEVFTVSRNLKTNDWLVLAALRTTEAFAPIASVKQQIYALALAISVVIALALGIVLKRELSALDEAASAMAHMTDGSAPFAPLPIRREDEIGMLVRSFNALVASRTQLDEALGQQRELYETLLDAQSEIGEGVFIVENEQVTFANDALCRLCGYSLDALRALPSFVRLLHPDDRERTLDRYRRRLNGERLSNRSEVSILTHDGRRLEVEVAIAVIPGEPPRVVAVMDDISERKRMQIALQHAKDELEDRVRERTSALDAANRKLSDEIAERRRLEQEIIEIAEGTQKRIGQELHDGLGQHLTGVAFVCKGLETRLAERDIPEADAAAKVVKLVTQAIDQTRQLARGLHPVELEANGLSVALTKLANGISEVFDIDCGFSHEAPVSVTDRIAAINLYRIAQEAVANAIKHGHARNISIRLGAANGKIRLTIADDGLGIGTADDKDRPGMGLHIMRYRANMLGATMEVRATPGGGTEVVVAQS